MGHSDIAPRMHDRTRHEAEAPSRAEPTPLEAAQQELAHVQQRLAVRSRVQEAHVQLESRRRSNAEAFEDNITRELNEAVANGELADLSIESLLSTHAAGATRAGRYLHLSAMKRLIEANESITGEEETAFLRDISSLQRDIGARTFEQLKEEGRHVHIPREEGYIAGLILASNASSRS